MTLAEKVMKDGEKYAAFGLVVSSVLYGLSIRLGGKSSEKHSRRPSRSCLTWTRRGPCGLRRGLGLGKHLGAVPVFPVADAA
jgi:hypothetical protein